MASEKVLKQKEEAVNSLAAELKDASLVLLVDYRGITVEDATKLRKEVREANAEYKVIKNNIIKRALNANGENGLDNLLEGPTALITSKEDYLAPAKAIYNFSKNNDFYKRAISESKIITIAKLPSRQELLAKLAGALLGKYYKTCCCT